MKKHVNIPVFIPHLGCPNQCVFCNQRSISGVNEFRAEEVIPIIEDALSTIDSDTEAEIAFFGGSFTGIDRDQMERLLSIGKSYISSGRVKSMRCSTRPDYISSDVLKLLKKYGMSTVELGLQSASDRVLLLSKRGHTSRDGINAIKLIKNFEMSAVGQMMIGLPGSDIESEIYTANYLCECGVDAVRIYPTVVFFETELCQMTDEGSYSPLSLEDAVYRSAVVAGIFIKNGIDILRIGLCSSDNLVSDSTYRAGPNHPAIGELCINRIYYEIILDQLKKQARNTAGKVLTVYHPKGCASKVIGQNKNNKLRLISELKLSDAVFKEDDTLSGYSVKLSIEERKK